MVDGILKAPETHKKICSVLDSELVGKVIQLVKLPVNQVSMTKRVEHELQLHVPVLVAKVRPRNIFKAALKTHLTKNEVAVLISLYLMQARN